VFVISLLNESNDILNYCLNCVWMQVLVLLDVDFAMCLEINIGMG